MSFQDPLRTLLASVFFGELGPPGAKRFAQLFGEGLVFTLISSYLPAVLGLAQAGVISVFLVAASLTDRFGVLLEENRDDIYKRSLGPWHSNRNTAISLLAMFLGIFVGFLSVAAWLDAEDIRRLFAFTVETAGIREDSLLDQRFPSLGEALVHNSIVLTVIAFLSFVYRSYGAMLALCWNACVWAFVIGVLGQRSGVASDMSPAIFLALAMGAFLPHLALEGFAYILGSLAAIFSSKALASYSLGDPRVREVARVAVLLVVLSLAVLTLAAFLEATLAPALLSRL